MIQYTSPKTSPMTRYISRKHVGLNVPIQLSVYGIDEGETVRFLLIGRWVRVLKQEFFANYHEAEVDNTHLFN